MLKPLLYTVSECDIKYIPVSKNITQFVSFITLVLLVEFKDKTILRIYTIAFVNFACFGFELLNNFFSIILFLIHTGSLYVSQT